MKVKEYFKSLGFKTIVDSPPKFKEIPFDSETYASSDEILFFYHDNFYSDNTDLCIGYLWIPFEEAMYVKGGNVFGEEIIISGKDLEYTYYKELLININV